MSYIQHALGSAPGTANDSATLSGVTAGSTLVAFCFDGSSTLNPTGCSDAQGAYAAGNATPFSTDSVTGKVFTLQNANAGSHTATVTTSGLAPFIILVEMSAPAVSVSDTKANTQNGPVSAAADTLTSGVLTVSASATIIAVGVDTHVVDATKSPTAGTSFTDIAHNANGSIGSWRLERILSAVNAAGTFTAVTTADNFITMAAAILEPPSGQTIFDEDAGWIMISRAP